MTGASGAVLAISPHLDDAVFSAGGALAQLARTGRRVVVATVFTRTVPDPQGFALACQLDKGLGPEVDYMALRRAEDRAACHALGAEPVHLGFREAPHRGYGSAPELFGRVREDDTAAGDIAPALQVLIDDVTPELILAPQAIGGHVDHVAVVRAMGELILSAPVAWWRDYPYTVRATMPARPFADRFDGLDDIALPLDAQAQAAKLVAALAYASQIGFQFGGPQALSTHLADAAGLERFATRAADAVPLAQALRGRRPLDRELATSSP